MSIQPSILSVQLATTRRKGLEGFTMPKRKNRPEI